MNLTDNEQILLGIDADVRHLSELVINPHKMLGAERQAANAVLQKRADAKAGWVSPDGCRWLGSSGASTRKRASRAYAALESKGLIYCDRCDSNRIVAVKLSDAGRTEVKRLKAL